MTTEEFVKVYDCLSRIRALCENPHWTPDRKEAIVVRVNEAVNVLNGAEKRTETELRNNAEQERSQ